MPIYNIGNYLKKAISSVLNQTFSSFELLLINDGSTNPGTLKICNHFVNIDSRIKLLTKVNEGIEKTRIFGIENSKGTYLIFSDHDDWYSENAFEILYNNAKATNAEIVVAKYKEVINSWLPFTKDGFNVVEPKLIAHKEFILKYYSNFFGQNQFSVSTWGKIYKRSLFTTELVTLGFNPTEDVALNIQIFSRANNISFIDDVIYFHRFGGLTSKPNVKILLNNYEVLYYLKKEYLRKYTFNSGLRLINVELKNIIVHFIKTALIYRQFDNSEIGINLEIFRNTPASKEFEKYYKENFNNHHFSEDFYNYYITNNWEAIIKMYKDEIRKGRVKRQFKLIANKLVSIIN